VAGISTFNINIKEITDVAERDIATKAVKGIQSPNVVSESGNISNLIDQLRSSASEVVKGIATQLGIELSKAVMSAVKNALPVLTKSLTQISRIKKQVTTQPKEQGPPLLQRKERISLPSQTQTAEQRSLISSSDVLMSQIQKDFINFKVNFAKSIRAQLTSSHGRAFQVIGQGAMPYTRRGGAEVLKIANIDMLIGALKNLTNISEKQALALVKEKGPGELVKRASRAAMQELSGGFGKTKPEQTSQSIAKITEYINKHGYEGLNKGIKKIVQNLKPESGVVEEQIRTALLTKKGGTAVSQTKLQDLLAETAGRTRVQERIGAAIQEIKIPRPQAGPQGLPAIQMQSGRQRALTEEYRFTPGIMVAQSRAQQIAGAGGITSPIAKRAVGKIEEAAPELPRMILKDEKAALAEHSSNIMTVMKTDKKGRLDLINAYRETLSAKYGKKPTQPIPEGKKAQLKYLDDLSNKAKKLSIGFDDVLVALGKLTKTGIYDRLLDSLTKEAVGVTSPMRTTVGDLATSPQAVKTFNKRINEVFSGQELVEEGRPRLGWYQSKTAKLNVPRFAPGEAGAPVPGEERRQELVAYNRELEKFTTMKGRGYIGSQGIGESRAVEMAPDVVDKARQRMNVFTESIRDFMPLGELSNFARTIAPTYHGLGGGRTAGGKIIGGLEAPLLQSERGRAAEKAGTWGKGGYGLNLQTEIRDTSGTFEDQIEIAGKAVNRFATYIKPKIKDVKDIGGSEVVAKDIISTFAPEMGKALHMKEPGKAAEGTKLITEISKILTGPGGESLNTRAVKIVEKIFTQLGTKMTTAAGSKGVVTFGTGKEGELGYREMPTSPHELLQGMLRKKRGKVEGKGAKVEIDKAITDLDKAGTKPFVSFMHKDLPKAVQKKYKEIRDSIQKILGIDLTVSPETIANIRSTAKKELGEKAMTKKVATEVRMSLTGATKRLNLMEPLEAAVNNITGNVEAMAPKLTPKQLSQKGEVSQYLQAAGYGWGPEEKLPMEKRTLPMYTGKGAKGVIAGQKFWQYPREPAAQEEWATRDIETGRKGQKLNVAAMGALTSVFGEKSAMVQEAMGGFRPEKGRALENIMALKSLGEEPIQTKAPYIPTTGMKELPGVISKYEDLRDTILDKKFGAGGFAEVPEFEGGKEVGKRPLYIPSRESLGMYTEEGGAAGANKLATMYGSLLTNVEEYGKANTREYPKGERANVDILRKNVKGQIGKTSSDFRKMLESVSRGERPAILGDDLKNLINYFKKVQTILQEARAVGDPALKKMATPVGDLMKQVGGGISNLEQASKSGKGITKTGVYGINKLLRTVKDSMLEPKVGTEAIKRTEADLEKMKTKRPLTDLSSKAYYFHKRATETYKKKDFTSEQFEADTPEVRKWVENSLKRYLGALKSGKGKPGLLSIGEGPLGVAAKQFGITTDPKQQALEERQKAIERDKYRLKKELMESTIGGKKGVETLQTRTIPAISGTLSAAINTKVEDFKAATEIIKNLGAKGVLGDTGGLIHDLEAQTKKHEKAVAEEAKGDRIVLREGEVGLPAGKLEKLTGDYGAAGKNLLEATRAGKNVPVMTTRFPMTGLASHQFARAKEVTQPGGRDIISLPGAAPGIDVSKMESIIGQLKKRQPLLRKERAELPDTGVKGGPSTKQLDAQRASLTKNILELSKAIDLVTVKFSGFAQNADIDGDTLMVHAGKTKAAQKEIAGVERARRTGTYGKVGARDPRAFINQMMNYNIKKQTSSMAELADLYATKAQLPAAKLFQTPEITREMKGVSFGDVEKGLKKFNITLDDVSKIATKKGFTEPKQVEAVARETLYEKTRAAQYGKLYVKTGLGESTEAISRVARFMEGSVGFGERQITKPEYAAWKPESVALGAVYGKGGTLTQKAKPGREMQTMMNVLLEQVINQAMSAKHGGKAVFQEVTQGLASGTLFKSMQEDTKLPKKDQRFKGILKANEIIKTIIRDRLDALNAVDFAAEAKRHKVSGKGRASITNELVDQFSFEGFLGATAKDIQGQVLKTAEGKPKKEAGIKRQIAKGELDLGMYFPQMQPEYALRTSSASIEKFAKQAKKGKTTLDKALTRVLSILKSTGTGVSVSDAMMSGAFKDMFGLFKKAEGLGVNLEKIFAKSKSAKQKRRAVSGLERQLGMPMMGITEKAMIREEGAEKFRKKYPKAAEEDVTKFQEEYLFKERKAAIEQHVKTVASKKQLMMDIVPSIGMKTERERIIPLKEPPIPKPKGLLMLQPGYGYISEKDVPDIGVPPTTLRETLHGVKQGKPGKIGIAGDLSNQEAKLAEAMAALRGGAKGKDYAALTESQTNEIVKTLKRYTEALNLLFEGVVDLTSTKAAKIQTALDFIRQNAGTLAAVPAGTKLGAAAKSAVSTFRAVRSGGYEDFAARAGISVEAKPSGEIERPAKGVERPPITGKYKTELEALQGFVAAAKKRTGYSPEGKSEKIRELLSAVRGEPSRAAEISSELKKETYKEGEAGRLPKEKGMTVWSQYHLEKVRGELDKAMEAEAAGSVYHREEAVGRAKENIRRSYGGTTTPFLTRAEGVRGRVTGYADEEAASMLGLVRMPTVAEDVGRRISKKSKTAGVAVAPVLSGVGRMEERLKVMWARIRNFTPELAKAGKAFNFDTAQADLAIIKDELKGFKFFGDFSSEEAADIDHAISKVTKMQKAVQEAPKKALPTLAIPELETTETAAAAFENEIAATIKEMKAQKDLAVGETRKVVAKIPTAEGQIEKRQVSLIARGAKEGIVAPGVVGGIERIEGKPTIVQKEAGISRRSVRLIKEFEISTDNVNKKIQNIWLGIKRFDKAAGTVDFSEALKDLADMQALLAEMLKNPLLSQQKFAELSQLKRKVGTAIRTVAETPAEGMKAVIMKGMETPESAKAALEEQKERFKTSLWEREDLAPGQKFVLSATLPTQAGVAQKRKIQFTATGEGGLVTGFEEQEYKTAKKYAQELKKGKGGRAEGLVSQFMVGKGDANKRISDLLLGVKQFDVVLAKAGKHTQSINFDNAEKDLTRIIHLLKEAQKGAVLLTEEERSAYKQAELATKALYQKVVKTPAAARKGIYMGGYETPESSLAAHRAKIEQGKLELKQANEIGKSMVIKSKLMTKSGEEMPISKRITARGSRFFGLGGPVTQKSVKEREEVSGGQVGSVIRRVAMWGAASGAVYGIIGGAKQMLQTMKQAETGLVNLKKVMSHVTTDFDHMRDSAVRFAKDYGAELMGVFETMRIFAQQGLPQEQVREMTRVATLAANVTTMKPPEAAEALTSATRQFNIEGEKSIAILDSWNEVENKFAITAKDLADGFKKAGTAAKITGIDVHKLNGIITAIGEATRQTGKEVGTSLKFIFSRMATEKAPRAMKAVGVKTMEGGKLREGSAILDDLAKKWVTLTRSQKLATAQAIGGIRHYNALMVMMDNYDRALAATAASINSVGSAEKENKMIMETFEKKTAQLKASFDALAVSASGPILASLGKLTDSLRSILEVMTAIPGAALAAMGTASYMAATGLGKYFDLSMFGLLGSSVGGAKRERRTFPQLLKAPFVGKADIGRGVFAGTAVGKKLGTETVSQVALRKTAEVAPLGLAWSEKQKLLRSVSRSGGVSSGELLPKFPSPSKLDLAKKGFKGISSTAKTAMFAVTGLVASFGLFAKIALVIGSVVVSMWAFDKVMRAALPSAEDKTKKYKETLDKVEESLKTVGDIGLLKTKIEITEERIEVLKTLTPAQQLGQLEGRSYKSPILMRKQNIEDVKDYAGAVSRLTSEGVIGFDSFGKAIVTTTGNLESVVTKLEEISTKAKVELKLKIEKEKLKELFEPPDIKGWVAKAMYHMREAIGNIGESLGAEFIEGYAESRRTPFENLQKTLIKINKLQREATVKGRVIAQPQPELEKTDPKKYKEEEKAFDEYTKAQEKRIKYSKEINDTFLEVRRDFFTIRGPGITPKLAGKAAFGKTGQMLVGAEQAQARQFYEEQGATKEDIGASFFHRLRGTNVRATARLTQEAAMEQGIPFRPVKPEEDKAQALGGARAKDVLVFKQGSKIASDQATIFESNGKLMVQWVDRAVEGEKQKERYSVETLEKFKQLPGYAKDFVGMISAVGMLSPIEMRLKSISRAFVGAEAGMFKPTKERKLELGKKYRYQVPTEMLIQNNAYKTMSKSTTGFVTEYIKKQSQLRAQQKASLSIYEKRGAISGQTSRRISEMTESLIQFSNTAVQFIRTNVELEKSLEQLEVGYKKQQAVRKFRRENLVNLTGPMAGTSVIPAPKIDLRKIGELSPHEKLRLGSKEYEKNLVEYTDKLDKYTSVAKQGEKIAEAKTDIDYIRGLEKERPGSVEDIEALVKTISKTGDLASGSQLLELERQTRLEEQSVTSLSNIVALLSGDRTTGLALLEQASETTSGPKQTLAFDRANLAVKSELKTLFSQGKFGEVEAYYKEAKELSGSDFELTKTMSQFFAELGPLNFKELLVGSGALLPEQERGKLEVAADWLRSRFSDVKPTEEEGAAYKAYRKGTATEEQKRMVSEVEYRYAEEGGTQPLQAQFSVEKVMDYMVKMGEKAKASTTEGVTTSPIEILNENIKAAQKQGKNVEQEVIKILNNMTEENKTQLEFMIPELLSRNKALAAEQKAIAALDKVSGNLYSTISNLSSSFLNLDRQSEQNKKVIDARARYMNIKGGPLKREALPVNIDTATSPSQYTSHQVLYERRPEYREKTRRYLKEVETVKTERNKVEEVAKIRGTVSFLEKLPGVKSEDLDTIISGALEAGSIDNVLMGKAVSALAQIVISTEATASNIDKLRAGDTTVTGSPTSEDKKKTAVSLAGGKNKLNLLREQHARAAAVAEEKAAMEADNLSAEQIRMQTARDIAAGRGRSQDQINREESEYLTTLGYIPEEIRKRNQQLLKVYEDEKKARSEWERAKQESLKPLQESASGMQSLIDSIRSGVTGIKGARNVRPLEIDFSEWAERQGTSEIAQERVADKRMQFDLAKSLYSQNLNLRAQGADTGVAPRRLYDIMKKASEGKDVTKDLEQIQKSLTEKKKEREEQIRKIQAEEYARAVKEVVAPHDKKLESIKGNTDKLITIMSDAGHSIVDAVNASSEKARVASGDVLGQPAGTKSKMAAFVQPHQPEDFLLERDKKKSRVMPELSFEEKAAQFVQTDFGYTDRLKEATKTEEEVKKEQMVESAARGGLAMSFPAEGEKMTDFTTRMDEERRVRNTQEAMQAGLAVTPVSESAKRIYADPDAQLYDDMAKKLPKKEKSLIPTMAVDKQLITDKEKVATMFDEVNQITSIPKEGRLTPPKDVSEEKQRKFDKSDLKQKTKEITKVGAEQVKETKNVNDEMSDLKDEIVTLKTAVSDVNALFEKLSKGLDDVSDLGDKSKDSAVLIETLGKSASDASSSLDTLSTKMDTVKSPETGTEAGPTMMGEEGYEYISEDSDIIKNLINKTDNLVIGVNSIEQNMLELSEGLVTTDNFVDFKKEISGYFEEISGLKTLVEDLNKDMILNKNYTLESKGQFEIILNRLQTYDTAFTKIEENVSSMDHKFTDAIAELHEEVIEAIDLARSAYGFASQAINQI